MDKEGWKTNEIEVVPFTAGSSDLLALVINKWFAAQKERTIYRIDYQFVPGSSIHGYVAYVVCSHG